jgi:hypothetical protein
MWRTFIYQTIATEQNDTLKYEWQHLDDGRQDDNQHNTIKVINHLFSFPCGKEMVRGAEEYKL